MRALFAGIFALAVASCALAQSTDAARVLRRFDFEERDRNPEDVPMDWLKVEGPGLPHYVNGTLATDQAAGGKYSFRFDLNGGSLIYRYPAGKIQVHPQASYRVTAQAKTRGIENARARMTAYCTDIDGHPIKQSLTHSRLFQSTANAFEPLSIDLTAPQGAAWLVIELGLVQANVWREPIPGSAVLAEQDIHGQAWFDEVEVAQVPKVSLWTEAAGNVFRRSEPVVLHVSVQDRITDDLVGQLRLVDAEGRAVFQRTGALTYAARPGADADSPKQATLALPELPAGWFRAQLHLSSQGIVVGDESIDFIQLADNMAAVTPDTRFGIVATDLPFAGWRQLPALLSNLGAARAKVAVWGPQGDAQASPDIQFEQFLEAMHDAHVATTACLAAPPPQMATALGSATWDRLADVPPDAWQTDVSYLMARYSGYIDRWQFGLDEDAARFASNPGLRSAYQKVRSLFDQLVPTPNFAMPWPAWVDGRGDSAGGTALNISSAILPQQIPLYLKDLKVSEPFSISLQPLPRNQYGRLQQLRDFAQRFAYALSAGATNIDLPLPFDAKVSDGRVINQPQELLLVMRTMMMTLGNATYKGRVPLDPDVEAFLFDRAGEGVLLVWSKADHDEPKTVPVMLGKDPRSIDLWGNVSPVLRSKDVVKGSPADDLGTTLLDVGPVPQFLVGIDAMLAQFRSGFTLDNPLLESSFTAHSRLLSFKNPYATSISGTLRLKGPSGWTAIAQQPSFNLAAGETFTTPVTIEFPYSSLAGEKTIVCTVDLQAEAPKAIKVPITVRLGLGDIGIESFAVRDGQDIVVQQMITNYGSKAANYTAFVMYPNQARQERLVYGLKPGTTTIKKYRFSNIDPSKPAKVRSGLRETEGTRILNDEIDVR